MKRLLLLVPLLLAAGCASLASDITPPPGYVYTTPVPAVVPTEVPYFPFVPPNPETGAAIFAEKCAPCHGDTGLGDGPEAQKLPNPVAPLADLALARQRTPADWFRAVTNGNIDKYMPPFTSLTDRERWDVIAYALTLSASETDVAQGSELYQANCAACHGITGLGDGIDAINQKLTPGDFTDQAGMAERSLDDLIQGMAHANGANLPDFTGELTPADQLALAKTLRALTFAPPGEAAAAASPLEDAVPTEGNGTPEAAAPPEVESLSQGDITGQVINASGGEVSSGLEVSLFGFDEFQRVLTETTTTDDAGKFIFEAVRMPEGRAFITTVDFDRGTFTSDVAVAGEEGGSLNLPISVFEASTDTSQLSIDRLHVFFEFLAPDMVRVAELILITNPTNRMIVAAQEGDPVIEFALPPGAVNLQFQDGAVGTQFSLTSDGFGDLRGITPGVGEHQILFSFDMPYSSNFDLNQRVDLAVSALVVLLPQVGVEANSDFLISDGVREVEGQPYELLTGGSLPAGSVLPVSLSGQPDVSGSNLVTTGSGSGLIVGLVALGSVVVMGGAWLYQRQSRNQPVAPLPAEEPLPIHIEEMSTEELMDSIIALDERFKAGDLPESAYLKQRKMLKDRLRDLLAGDR